MAFTTGTITHGFKNADGTPASGSFTFTLSDIMTNGTSSIAPGEVPSTLDGSGDLSIVLTSNLDTATWSLSMTGTSGSVQLSIGIGGGETVLSQPIGVGATAAQVQAAITSMDLSEQDIVCTGGPLGSSPVLITGVPGNKVYSVTNSTLVGGSATVTNTVTGTTPAAPQNTQWRVDFRIQGAKQQTFWITVPAGGGSYDLFTLIPNTRQLGE